MSDLIAPVDGDGKVNISETSQKTERKSGDTLDKEDFVLLLVTQMQYQDPLERTSNTEYVAQLAQFSELEQMQNLNSTTVNTSAYNLVGKEVLLNQTLSSGDVVEVQGTVDYVTIQNGTAYVSVNGSLYEFDDIVQVIDSNYLISQYIPKVEQQVINYSHDDPQDVMVSGISLGTNGYEATGFAVVIMDANNSSNVTKVDASKLSYKDGKLTIDREVFSNLDAGNYKIAFVFDDANKTMDYSSVSLCIKGIKQNNGSSSGSDSSDDTDKTDGTESVNGTNSTEKTDSTGDNDSTEGTDAV